MKRKLTASGFCGLLLLSSVGCRQSEQTAGNAELPNVLLISLDTTRADHCSFLGYAANTTPNLRRLALEGASFEQAFSPTPSTAPSHATMFTSLYPVAHGLVKNTLTLDEEHLTLTEVLRAHGYQTASVVSSFVLHSKFGFSQGFEAYDDEFDPRESVVRIHEWEDIPVPAGVFDRRGDHTTDRAIRLLESRDPERPIFLFVHYFDPHAPYSPPEPFRSRFSSGIADRDQRKFQEAYDGEIAFTDHQVGRLVTALQKLGLEKDTLIVVVGDHGEGLLQRGWLQHGNNVYEEEVRVPLLFRWPGHIVANRVVPDPVELVQLGSTILGLLEIDGEGPLFENRGWADALREGTPLDPQRAVFLQTDRSISRPAMVQGEDHSAREDFAIRRSGWKFIEGPKRISEFEWSDQVYPKALFNLEEDSSERTNLLAKFPDKAEELAEELHRWKAANTAPESHATQLSEEEIRGLRSLGYVE